MEVSKLFEGHSRALSIEAAYYAVRALKQSSVPPESRKAHLHDASRSKPSAKAQALSRRIIAAIEREEHGAIETLSNRKRLEYIGEIWEAAESLTRETLGDMNAVGKQLLAHLRASA